MRTLMLVLAAGLLGPPAIADDAIIAPGPNLIAHGIPPIPQRLANAVAPYTEYRGQRLIAWHPTRREMLIARRAERSTQIFRLEAPQAVPMQVTDLTEPIGNAVFPRGFQADAPEYFLFGRDEGGNERYRMFRFDLARGETLAHGDPARRAGAGVFGHRGDTYFYGAVVAGRSIESEQLTTEVRALQPDRANSDRLIARLPGIGWSVSDITSDDRTLVLSEFRSVNESYLWVFDVATGTKRLLTPKRDAEPVAYRRPTLTANDREVLALSDRGSEFTRIVAIDLETRAERVVAARDWGVVAMDLSSDGRHLAYLTNEDGASVLRIIALATGKPIAIPALPRGVASGLRWRPGAPELGLTLSAADGPAMILTLDLARGGQFERWTREAHAGPDPSRFVAPEILRWRSFDGRAISGLAYLPDDRHKPPYPVIIDIHGGPESQSRPSFLGRMNYFVDVLGVTILYPNVRGSSGFGKSFLKADDGKRREDAVRDIGALLDRIGGDARFDTKRVLVTGASYGGYMSLATAVHYADRIACAQSEVGIANLVSFLERTESYRRDLRRAEYGDERDPRMRAFLESISPLNHARAIVKPLFVVHGANDPRVPLAEAESIIEAVRKNGTPVWSLIARDEGHGFAKKSNADFLFYATVAFATRCLGLEKTSSEK